MRVRAGALVVAVALVGTATPMACSSFSTGQTSGNSAGDAAADPPPGPINEGGVDGGASGAAFCSGRPSAAVFCRDFDSVASPTEGWQRTRMPERASLINSDKSPPRAVQFRLDENEDADNKRYATFEGLARGGFTTGVELAADVLMEQPDWTANHRNVGIASFSAEQSGQEPYQIFVVVERTGVAISARLPAYEIRTSSVVWPYDRWVHLKLSIGAPANSQLPIELSLDGVNAITMVATYSPVDAFDARYVGIGLFDFNPPSPPFDIRFDNVELSERR